MIIIAEAKALPEDVIKAIEDLDEKKIKKLTDAMEDLQEFAKFGAERLESTFTQATSSSAFALPMQMLIAKMNSSEYTADALKKLVAIIKDPEFKLIIEYLAGSIGTFASFIAGICKTFYGLGQVIIELIKLLSGKYKGAKIELPPDPLPYVHTETISPFWWLNWIRRVMGW